MAGGTNSSSSDATATATAHSAVGNVLTAQLSSRYFRPGGVVRGVVHLRASQTTTASAATEIAFVVAQIHAHVTVDSNLLTVPVVPLLSPRSAYRKEREQLGLDDGSSDDGAFAWETMRSALPDVQSFAGDAGTCIYQSAPSTLLTDINIAQTPAEVAATDARSGRDETAQRCTREFAIALPPSACPTFRGTAARVVYVLSVTAQAAQVGSASVSVHLPFDVYAPEFFFEPTTLESADEYAAQQTGATNTLSATSAPASATSESLRERSLSVSAIPVGVRKGSEVPFELRPSLMHGRVETEAIQKAQTSIFTIGKDNSHLVRFLLTKQSYQPGDVLLGVFDFARAAIPCYEVSATLCFEETLAAMSVEPSRVVRVQEIGTFHEFTDAVTHTHVQFCIPHDALPTIKTDLVCFQWLVRFEFTAGVVVDGAKPATAAAAAKRQTFRWQVPIVVRPAAATARSQFANVPHKLFSGSRRSVKLL